MSRFLRSTGAVALLASVSLGACSSSKSSGGGATFSSGLPTNESAGSLSDGDYQKLCDAVRSFYTNNTATSAETCKAIGLAAAAFQAAFDPTTTDADLQKMCSDTLAQCQKTPPTTPDAGAGGACQKPTGTCTATVGELETCVNDTQSALSAAIAAVPACSTVTRASLESDAGTSNAQNLNPQSCQTVAAECPSLGTGGTATL